MKKAISLLLVLAMLLPAFASCSEAPAEAETETSADTGTVAEAETETDEFEYTRANIPDNLPEKMDFDGAVLGLYTNNPSKCEEYYSGPEEMTGEVVNDAVIQRNIKVAERLNIDYDFNVQEGDIAAGIKNVVMSGDTSMDLLNGAQWEVTPLVTGGYFLNSMDAPYLDLEQPWWNLNYMNELTMGNKVRYFLVGDFFLDVVARESTIFFNKNLYNDFFGNPDDLYNLTLEGNWTMDYMTDLVQNVYVDTDGNGVVDETDTLGYVTWSTGSSVDAFVFGTDTKFTSRDENNYLVLELMSDRAMMMLEKMNKLFHGPGANYGATGRQIQVFSKGNALFVGFAIFHDASQLREMEDDFGFLPYPKLDETQEEYRTLVQDQADIGALSSCCAKPEMVYATLEALCAETYRTVTPAWYETALKNKYTRDALSQQMIDLIHDTQYTTFLFAYNYAIAGVALVYRDLVGNNSNDLASHLKILSKAADKTLAKLIKQFEELS